MRRASVRSEDQKLWVVISILVWVLKQGLTLYPELASFALVTTLLPQPPQYKIIGMSQQPNFGTSVSGRTLEERYQLTMRIHGRGDDLRFQVNVAKVRQEHHRFPLSRKPPQCRTTKIEGTTKSKQPSHYRTLSKKKVEAIL